jgi:hypothetical protein
LFQELKAVIIKNPSQKAVLQRIKDKIFLIKTAIKSKFIYLQKYLVYKPDRLL